MFHHTPQTMAPINPNHQVEVNGLHAHPLYHFMKRELPVSEGGGGGVGPGHDLPTNFQKVRGQKCGGS